MNENSNSNMCCSNKTDCGPNPFVVNIAGVTMQNRNFRKALWTGEFLQLTLMCINPCEEVGLEMHSNLDQFIRIEEGCGLVVMGSDNNKLTYQRNVAPGCAIFVPAGTWHNLLNMGNCPLKLYSIYAPPEHPHGTIHETKAIAEASENHHSH